MPIATPSNCDKPTRIRVGFLSYPMLFQRQGGLQNQILQSMAAVSELGIEPDLPDLTHEDLAALDVIHVFSAINGNYRIVQEAKTKDRPVIISPLIQPDIKSKDSWRFRLASKITGRLTGFRLRTTFDQEMDALCGADHIIALSADEKRVLTETYKQSPERISVIPNGIQPDFFRADENLFKEKTGIKEPFVFVAGTISPYKNQLGVIEATARGGVPVVLAGPIGDHDYFMDCIEAGKGRLTHVGSYDYNDPLLTSAYAAASVTVLASEGEAFGLTAAESLAAGTPAVITKHNGLDLKQAPPFLTFVNHKNIREISAAIENALGARRDRQSCQEIVAHLS